MRSYVLVASLPAVALAACGGSGGSPAAFSPTPAPTPIPQIVLMIQSGEDEASLPGAAVSFAGNRLQPDGQGRVTLPASARTGNPIDVLAPGFFDRLTTVPSISRSLGLWPLSSVTGLDEVSTSRLVYTSTEEGAPLGQEPLRRPEAPVYLLPSEELQGDSGSMAELGYAATTVTEATGGRLPFTVSVSPPPTAIRFDVRLDPADAYCKESGAFAFCRRSSRGGSITGGTIVFCRKASLYSLTMTHEVGHAFGLNHSTDPRDMMGVPYTTRRSSTFTAREQLAMRLMLQRPPGNRFPDTDRTPSAAATSESIVVCR